MTEKTKVPNKASKATIPAPATEPIKEAKPEKQKKEKLIRDGFTMPASEYAQLAAIKERCLKSSVNAKKSEVLRAALKSLANLSDVDLTKAITALDFIKTGRPGKDPS